MAAITGPAGASTQAPPKRNVTDRIEFRVWTATITFIVFAALALGIGAMARASSAPKATAASGNGGSGAAAAPAGRTIDWTNTYSAGFKARDPNAPPTPTGTVHDITLHAKQVTLEVAPGVKQLMWTFGGTVPGPIFRGNVGDTFNFTIVNDDKVMSHSIDFHASMVAPNVQMAVIPPGGSHLYSFVANHSGFFMYHCGTPPVIQHVGMGMYGAVIINPPNLAPVDHEYVMLQSEIYLGKTPTALPDLSALLNRQWSEVVFNGAGNQYVAQPLKVQPNQRIRIWVFDDGPSEPTSFHIIGTIFDTVYKEGNYLLRPGMGEGNGGSQSLDLTAAQGGFVETTFPVAGIYTILNHDLAMGSQGALGKIQVGDVSAVAGGH